MTTHLILKENVNNLETLFTSKVIPIVDAIITDPPYCVANKNIIKFNNRKDMSRDFGEWDYFDEESYQTFISNFYLQANKVLKPYGNIISFCRLENITMFVKEAAFRGFEHKATIIWHKTNPAPRVRKTGMLSACEGMVWSVKTHDINLNIDYDKPLKPTFHFGKQNEMHNFIETPICMGKERTKHTTQKPRKVIEHLMKIFTNENDTILDCFAGSGTTAEVSILNNRNSINLDIDQVSIDIMRERLSKHSTSEIIIK